MKPNLTGHHPTDKPNNPTPTQGTTPTPNYFLQSSPKNSLFTSSITKSQANGLNLFKFNLDYESLKTSTAPITNRAIRSLLKQQNLSKTDILNDKNRALQFYNEIIQIKPVEAYPDKGPALKRQLAYLNRLCLISMRHLAEFHLTGENLYKLAQPIINELGLSDKDAEKFLIATVIINFNPDSFSLSKTLLLAVPSLVLGVIAAPVFGILNAISTPFSFYNSISHSNVFTKILLFPFYALAGAVAGIFLGLTTPFILRAKNVSGGKSTDSETRAHSHLMKKLSGEDSGQTKGEKLLDSIPSVATFKLLTGVNTLKLPSGLNWPCRSVDKVEAESYFEIHQRCLQHIADDQPISEIKKLIVEYRDELAIRDPIAWLNAVPKNNTNNELTQLLTNINAAAEISDKKTILDDYRNKASSHAAANNPVPNGKYLYGTMSEDLCQLLKEILAPKESLLVYLYLNHKN